MTPLRRRSVAAVAAACFALLALLPSAALAQVEISWSFAHPRVPLFAPIPATVKLTNVSGVDLSFGPGGTAGLTFQAEDSAHRPAEAQPSPRPLLAKGVSVPNGATVCVTVDVSRVVRLCYADSYMVTPVVTLPGATSLVGKRLSLELQPGLVAQSREFGLAGAENHREATLRVIHRPPSDIVFFRLDNPTESACYGVYELGTVIRYFTPQIELDADSVIHVLFQNTPDRFVHAMFDYVGRPSGIEVYIARVGAISLVRSAVGDVVVNGGTRFALDPSMPGHLTAPSLPPSVPEVSFGKDGLAAEHHKDASAPAADAPAPKHWWQR